MKVASSTALCVALGVFAAEAAPLASSNWTYSCSAGENITSLHYNLTGQTYLVTGSDGRLGLPVTAAALRNGASVIATSRTAEAAETNCANFRAEFGTDAPISCVGMDLSSFAAVSEAVSSIKRNYSRIDVLLHVAATIGLDNVTDDGIVGTVEVNLMSPVYLNKLLRDELNASPNPRLLHIGSADAFDPIGWPATDRIPAAMSWITGRSPHPNPSQPYYWYSFTKFAFVQYAAELAVREPTWTSFSVNPGYFRDDPAKYNNTCLPALLFTPCPQFPDQGATSTFFTAATPGIEAFSGSLIDFETTVHDQAPFWVQSGDTCIPRPLPAPWDDVERSQWYDALQTLLPR